MVPITRLARLRQSGRQRHHVGRVAGLTVAIPEVVYPILRKPAPVHADRAHGLVHPAGELHVARLPGGRAQLRHSQHFVQHEVGVAPVEAAVRAEGMHPQARLAVRQHAIRQFAGEGQRFRIAAGLPVNRHRPGNARLPGPTLGTGSVLPDAVNPGHHSALVPGAAIAPGRHASDSLEQFARQPPLPVIARALPVLDRAHHQPTGSPGQGVVPAGAEEPATGQPAQAILAQIAQDPLVEPCFHLFSIR